MKFKSLLPYLALASLLAVVYWERQSQRAEALALREEVRLLRAEQAQRLEQEQSRQRNQGWQRNRIALRRASSPALVNAAVQIDDDGVAPPVLDESETLAGAQERSAASDQRPVGPVAEHATLNASMDAAFNRESVDGGWARAADSEVRHSLLERLPSGSELRDVQCRASMCRIETHHAGRTRLNQFMRAALDEPADRPWNGSFASGPVAIDASTGSITIVTFLLREGRELPPLIDKQP